MNRKLAALLTVMAFSINGTQCLAQEHKAAPVTRTDNAVETLHGIRITDPYRWLEDQDSPETRAWIKVQNEHTESILGTLPIRGKIRERLTQLLKIDTMSTPFARGGR